MLCLTLPGGTAIQVIQEAVPNQLRGQASGVYYLLISVIGLSIGSLSVALLNDCLFADPRANAGNARQHYCAAPPAARKWMLRASHARRA